jgi:hypothetical protein
MVPLGSPTFVCSVEAVCRSRGRSSILLHRTRGAPAGASVEQVYRQHSCRSELLGRGRTPKQAGVLVDAGSLPVSGCIRRDNKQWQRRNLHAVFGCFFARRFAVN